MKNNYSKQFFSTSEMQISDHPAIVLTLIATSAAWLQLLRRRRQRHVLRLRWAVAALRNRHRCSRCHRRRHRPTIRKRQLQAVRLRLGRRQVGVRGSSTPVSSSELSSSISSRGREGRVATVTTLVNEFIRDNLELQRNRSELFDKLTVFVTTINECRYDDRITSRLIAFVCFCNSWGKIQLTNSQVFSPCKL